MDIFWILLIGVGCGFVAGIMFNRGRVSAMSNRLDNLKNRIMHQLDILENAWKDGVIDIEESRAIRRSIYEVVLEEDIDEE